MKCSKRNATQHDYSFNFWIGCHRLSEGCKNCYMFLAQSRRPWTNPNEVKLCTSTWAKPRTWQKEAAKAGEASAARLRANPRGAILLNRALTIIEHDLHCPDPMWPDRFHIFRQGEISRCCSACQRLYVAHAGAPLDTANGPVNHHENYQRNQRARGIP